VIGVSPDGKHIATGDFHGYLRIYDEETGEEIKEIKAHD
jgi:WD40 repeat protein